MHILFISYDGMTDPLGQSQVIPYLAGLTKYGYRFTILSCDKPDKYTAQQADVRALLAAYPINWVSLPYHKNPPVLSSVFDYWQLRKKAAELHQQDPFVMVHTRVGIPTLVALWLKKKFGIKFLNDIRGFWADERVDGGMWNLKNPLYKLIYRFFKNKEAECLRVADYQTCLTYAARAEIHRWDFIPNQPIPAEVIPCSADLDLFNRHNVDPLTQQRLRDELKLGPTDRVISYLGSIGGWYLTEAMMQCCAVIAKRLPDVKFLFISPHGHDAIRAAATTAGLPLEKLIIQSAKRAEVPVLLSLSWYSLFFIKPCYSKMSSSPTKHGEIMAMGIPVITNTGVGDVEKIVRSYDAGILVSDFNTADFEQVAEALAANPVIDAARIRAGAEEWYALERAVEKYRNVYRFVVGDAR